MVLALELLHAAWTLNAPLKVGPCVALLLDGTVTYGLHTPKHCWLALHAKAIGTWRGVDDRTRVESRCSCGSGREAVPAFCGLVRLG